MNTRQLASLLALGSTLPLSAWSQSQGSTEPRDPSEARRSSSAQETHLDPDASQKPGASARETHTPSGAGAIEKRPGHNSPHYNDPSDTSRQTSARTGEGSGAERNSDGSSSVSSDADGLRIQRVSTEDLKQRATASSLMGKKLLDREGQRVGEVQDVGLGMVAPHLARNGAEQNSSSSTRGQNSSNADTPAGARHESRTTLRDTGGPAREGMNTDAFAGSTSPGLRASGTSGRRPGDANGDRYLSARRLDRQVDRAGTAGSDRGLQASSDPAGIRQGTEEQQFLTDAGPGEFSDPYSTAEAGPGEARVFVKPDRALGTNGDLVAIPASKLYREGNELRVDLTREELRELVAREEASRVTLNR